MGILLAETGAAGAAADPTATVGSMGLVGMLLYMALMVGIFWFILIRPQRKEKKKLAAMLQTLEIGDVVLTTSGFYGVLIDIKDDMVIVEFGNNKNCRIPMEKGAISRVEKADES